MVCECIISFYTLPTFIIKTICRKNTSYPVNRYLIEEFLFFSFMCFLKMYCTTLIHTNLRVDYPEKDFACSKHIKLMRNGNVPFHTLSTLLFSMVNSAFSTFEFEPSSRFFRCYQNVLEDMKADVTVEAK